MSISLTSLKTRAARELQDPSKVTWVDAELQDFANDGQREVLTKAPMLRKIITMASNASYDATRPYAYYKPPTGTVIVGLHAVWNAGVPLSKSSVPDELDSVTSWEDAGGTPTRYDFGNHGPQNMRVMPFPSAALTSLRAWVSYLADDMATGTDVPAFPDQWHHVLVDYMVWRALSRNGEKQYADLAAVRKARWDAMILEAQEWTRITFDTSERHVAPQWF